MIKLIGTLVWPSSSEIAVICIGHVFKNLCMRAVTWVGILT